MMSVQRFIRNFSKLYYSMHLPLQAPHQDLWMITIRGKPLTKRRKEIVKEILSHVQFHSQVFLKG